MSEDNTKHLSVPPSTKRQVLSTSGSPRPSYRMAALSGVGDGRAGIQGPGSEYGRGTPSSVLERVQVENLGVTNAGSQKKMVAKKLGVKDLTPEIHFVGRDEQDSLGCGGASDVFRGIWGVVGEVGSVRVAVKVFRPTTGKESLQQLWKQLDQEVDVCRRLDHPNIAKFHGQTIWMGRRPALVMEWCGRGTVKTYARGRSVACKLGLVKEVSAAVQYLHSLEPPIVHRDLKGENVLVDDEGHAKLIDFGLSVDLGTIVRLEGSPRWMAPENFTNANGDGALDKDGSQASLACDVWSFGCTAYEILTGLVPYRGYENYPQVVRAIARGERPVRPDDMLDVKPMGISGLLGRCWAVVPEDRPGMAEVTLTLNITPWS